MTPQPVYLTLPNLRAAIRGLTDTANVGPAHALATGHLLPGLSDNERETLDVFLRSYRLGCLSAGIDPMDGWGDR